MKKLALLLLTAIFVSHVALAIPANRMMIQMPQPDGTMLSVRLVGDEYYHFNTTADGYTIMLNGQGAYVYAQRVGDKLEPTSVLAHDADERGLDEIAFIAATPKGLTDKIAVSEANIRRAPSRVDLSNFDFENFRGVIILIDFTDKKFTSSNPVEFYTNLFNTKDLTEFYDPYLQKNVSCMGSVCDYFSDQSNGAFEPQFDVYGPYHAQYTKDNVRYDAIAADCDARHNTIFQNALNDANPDIDFRKYNGNGDDRVDMVYFLVAGFASSTEGNNDGYLWPHASNFYNLDINLDGLKMDRYASSTELYGAEAYAWTVSVEGVGTICHEFSHVLGLPDFYDTNYGEDGLSHHPGRWDIMAGGGDNDNGRAPVGYSYYERYALGWAEGREITAEGTYSLEPVNTSREGYILRTKVDNEFFIIENRQKTGWDTNLPGHGMIVTRVDSTNQKTWSDNRINRNPDHNYYELLRGGNTTTEDRASDPFPGSMGNVMISNTTYPSLKTWGGTKNDFIIKDITENSSIVSFNVVKENNVSVLVEDFERMRANTSTTSTNVMGVYSYWTFSKAGVREPGDGLAEGKHSIMMKPASRFYCVDPVYYNIYLVSMKVFNPSTSMAKYSLEYSLDDGETWVKVTSTNGSLTADVPAKTNSMCYWPLNVKNYQGTMLRITQVAGASSKSTYVDDLSLYYTGEEGWEEMLVPGDVNVDGEINIADVNALIDIILGGNLDADKLLRGDVDADGEVGISDINALIDKILS